MAGVRLEDRRISALVRVAMLTLALSMSIVLVGCGSAVPDTRGMTVEQATAALQSAGFSVGEVSYDEKAVGATWTVSAQAPAAGERASSDEPIALTLVGAPPVDVPDVTGKKQSDALAALKGAGLSPGAATQAFSVSVPSGVVASQTPSPGVSVPKGSSVALVVSKGVRPVAVPSVKGKAEADAKAALAKAGLKAAVQKTEDSAKKGTVIAQSPSAGLVKPGSVVKLVVSTGPPPVITVNPNQTVTLTGRVEMHTFTNPDMGRTDRAPVIVLDTPINVTADSDGGWGPARGVRSMQLAYNGDYEAFKARYVGARVRITGSLYYGDNQNHYTEVLVMVDSVSKR